MHTILTSRFQDALNLAFLLHQNQYRKGIDVPYISHLMGVCSLVLESGGSEDEAIAGLLHDAIEDQGGAAARELIREKFGDAVAEIVQACSDSETLPKPPWRERKEAYIAHLKDASPSVLLVTSADKLNNARSILSDYRQVGEELWGRFKGGKEGTLWYYQAFLQEMRALTRSSLLDELQRVVDELLRIVR
jgi:(p)ppGpp synthase/HD superfamily hydrolase